MRIFLTNLARASAVRVGRSGRHAHEVGPGPILGILRWPPKYATESGLLVGHVVSLMPKAAELAAVKTGELAWPSYRAGLLARWGGAEGRGVYRPGVEGEACLRVAQLSERRLAQHHPEGRLWDGQWWIGHGPVVDGSTLCCVCDDASRCHRSVAAEVLRRAGWVVFLDGEQFEITGESG